MARYVCIPGRVDRNTVGCIILATSQVGRVVQHWINYERLARVVVRYSKADLIPTSDIVLSRNLFSLSIYFLIYHRSALSDVAARCAYNKIAVLADSHSV